MVITAKKWLQQYLKKSCKGYKIQKCIKYKNVQKDKLHVLLQLKIST